MTQLRQGQLVIRRWSQASSLKKRAYVVLRDANSSTDYAVHVMDAYGKTITIPYYRLDTLEEAEARCKEQVSSAERNVDNAYTKVSEARSEYQIFLKEITEIPKFFPKV